MKANTFFDMLENIDDKTLIEAYNYKPRYKIKNTLKWTAVIAASVCTIIITAKFFHDHKIHKENKENVKSYSVYVGDVLRKYNYDYVNKFTFYEKENIEWNYEYLTLPEKIGNVNFNGKDYKSFLRYGRAVAAEKIDEQLGICKCDYDGKESVSFDVFGVIGIEEDYCIAVKLDKGYYLYLNAEASIPVNLGDLIVGFSLEKNINTDYCLLKENENSSQCYRLNDNSIFDLLKKCENAPLVQNGSYSYCNNYVELYMTLGNGSKYDKIIRIDADGYVLTNIMERESVYDIGKENAEKIMSYVKDNSQKTYEKKYYIVGSVTEINDKYILINDADFCFEKENALKYKISAEDLRIKRIVDSCVINTGDIVYVEFEGIIDTKQDNLIEEAYNLIVGNDDGEGGIEVLE